MWSLKDQSVIAYYKGKNLDEFSVCVGLSYASDHPSSNTASLGRMKTVTKKVGVYL